jgi:hypothetical protein
MSDQRKQQNQQGGKGGQQGGGGQKPGQQQQQQPNKKPGPGEQQAERDKKWRELEDPSLLPDMEQGNFCDVKKFFFSPGNGASFFSQCPTAGSGGRA